ncbi:MAG: N-6 DNA methylase [Dehalococcoidia bacterium]|nr:N-6 DNA methylase [Dehalococcoidia bacterium]
MDTFTKHLEDYLQNLADIRARDASEDTIRDAFLQFLRGAFPRLEQVVPLSLEQYVPAIRVRGGFADILFGDLIWEFKRRLDQASCADGLEKLQRYLSNQPHPERFTGILTDGETLEAYALQENTLQRIDITRLQQDKAEQVKLWLDSYLFHEKVLSPTATDVALRFGERSATFWHSRRLLTDIWQQRSADPSAYPSTQTKFAEWQSLLSIVYGSAVGNDDLFFRHTYLALFARVLAFVALQRRAPSEDEVKGLLDGDTFERLGLGNFVEDDFFTWPGDQATPLLQALATRLTATYELSHITEDLLKELYQELVDPATRHDLGEYYTPDWLAELILRQAGFPPPQRPLGQAHSLLDPACGSGTFLFLAVRLLREAGVRGRELAEFCASHMAGIDVHPLAVTIAKTNLILALGDDLRSYGRRFDLPIYMADALFEARPLEGALRVPVDTATLAQRSGKERPSHIPSQFLLPISLVARPDTLDEALDALIAYAKPDSTKKEEEEAFEGFRHRLARLFQPLQDWDVWEGNLRLMRWLLQPPATDSVWRFILKNAYRPALLAQRTFAFVVGNPPWLAYRYIARPDYQQRVRKMVFEHSLLEKRSTHLFALMEMATLFFAHCAERFLADRGTLAFVLPRSVLTQAKQHRGFQTRFLAHARRIIDCEGVVPLFQVPACAVVWVKGPTPPQPPAGVPCLRLEGTLPSRNAPWAIAHKHLTQEATTFHPPKPGAPSPYFEHFKAGACIYPRVLWFVRPPEDRRITDLHQPYLETDPSVKARAKPPWNRVHMRGEVESPYLFATLLSDDLLPFGWRRLSLVVLPLASTPEGQRTMLDSSAAAHRGAPKLADWLRKAESDWNKQRKGQIDLQAWLNWQGKLTRQHPSGVVKLLYNASSTHLCACVVDARDAHQWQVHGIPVQGFVADNTTYFLETQNSVEAHYICAILNAPLVDKTIKPFQTKGLLGERHISRWPFEVLPIPKFDPRNRVHLRLAALSEACHAKVARMGPFSGDTSIGRLRRQVRETLREEIKEIDALVQKMLG